MRDTSKTTNGLAWILCTVLLCVEPLTAPTVRAEVTPPDVTVSVDRRTGTVGDPITLTLTIRYDSALHLLPVPPARMVGAFEVLSDSLVSDSRRQRNQSVYERRWRLAVFEPGTFWIPSLSGSVADTSDAAVSWHSDSIAITIESVLTEADAETAEIRGLKGPYAAPVPISVWWYVLGAALVVLAAAYWWRRRRRKPADSYGPPPIPAWETAFADLQALQAEIDPELDGGRQWYFRLSEILRRYLDGRYGWQSIDQTTSEILRELDRAPFNGDHRERVRDFLNVADMVRYARERANVGRPQSDWSWVREFVTVTIPVLRPLEEEGTATAGDGAGASESLRPHGPEPSTEYRGTESP